MEPLRALPGVAGSLQVTERRGGGQQQADAFRRALQQRAGERNDGGAQPDGGADSTPAPATPVASGLQRRAGTGRKDGGTALHVDVIA